MATPGMSTTERGTHDQIPQGWQRCLRVRPRRRRMRRRRRRRRRGRDRGAGNRGPRAPRLRRPKHPPPRHRGDSSAEQRAHRRRRLQPTGDWGRRLTDGEFGETYNPIRPRSSPAWLAPTVCRRGAGPQHRPRHRRPRRDAGRRGPGDEVLAGQRLRHRHRRRAQGRPGRRLRRQRRPPDVQDGVHPAGADLPGDRRDRATPTPTSTRRRRSRTCAASLPATSTSSSATRMPARHWCRPTKQRWRRARRSSPGRAPRSASRASTT